MKIKLGFICDCGQELDIRKEFTLEQLCDRQGVYIHCVHCGSKHHMLFDVDYDKE